ncbi:MAG: hypothetical protein KDC80_25475, partial [Saprospiraceae bacterium]|nr:hypothetical protein [Saprospiraceae bacterium]
MREKYIAKVQWILMFHFLITGYQVQARSNEADLLAMISPIYVDSSAAMGGNGVSWATAFKHLQDALTLA